MDHSPLAQAVDNLARQTITLADADLDRKWDWLGYEEGVRFAFFRTCEQLNGLAASLAYQRSQTNPLSIAQHLLSDYHAAFRDLQAIILGISDQQAERVPAEGQWPARTALLHTIQAERAFYGVTYYTIQRQRADEELPLELSDEGWEAMWSADPFKQIKESGSFSQSMAYYAGLHSRVIQDLADIQQDELQAPSVFWESEPLPVSFRLGRFSSHMRQHTIQIEKILADLGLAPGEVRLLLRLTYAALAKVEGAAIGEPGLGAAERQALAEEIDARTAEILQVINL